jgi:hypothetical protein
MTNEHSTTFSFLKSLFDGWLPWITGYKIPFVQPGLYPFFGQAACNLLNGRFVCRTVRKKYVVGHFAAALPADVLCLLQFPL